MKKLKEMFFYILLVLLVIFILNIIYCKLIKKEKIVSIFGKTIFIVETGSMNPTICEGEMILVSKESLYEKGNIVTIMDNNREIYTHRIVEIKGEQIVTKGDNNDINDEEVSKENIVGKVIFHSKYLGFFIIYLLKPIIIIYIFIIVIKIIIIFEKELFYEKKFDN